MSFTEDEKNRHRQLVGRRIQLAREAAGLSQKALASLMGISQPALWNVETGASNPNLLMLVRAAEELGTTTDYFLRGLRNGLPLDLALRLPGRIDTD